VRSRKAIGKIGGQFSHRCWCFHQQLFLNLFYNVLNQVSNR
jgi:hypothetical protein